ncbi:hypothetical protein GWK47_022302 [Chionoecetes opilio]|uniref:Uncharacterized protein n=1 Tax=Chionoecetes opilio TaxID=41210 RepID=A0A8J4XN03_CHIOP|nr:hypothetical protein GWK47_022302 [Chionoecetes opilio]
MCRGVAWGVLREALIYWPCELLGSAAPRGSVEGKQRGCRQVVTRVTCCLGVASMNTAQPAPQAAFRHFRVSRCAWKSCSEYYFCSSPLGSLYIIQGTLLTPSDLLATCRGGPGHFSPPPPLSAISVQRHRQAAACSEQEQREALGGACVAVAAAVLVEVAPSIFSLPHTSIAVIAANRFMMTDG